jgi:hypothetical protein
MARQSVWAFWRRGKTLFVPFKEKSALTVSSSFHRVSNDVSWFLGFSTVCGVGWLTTTFRNSLSVQGQL